MADKEIIDGSVPSATALTGAEALHVVQQGNSRRAIVDQIVASVRTTGRIHLQPRVDNATLEALGIRTQAIGTSTGIAKSVTSASFLASLRRVGYGGDAGANFSGGFFSDETSMWRGNSDGRGGFTAEITYGLEALNAAAQTKLFVGFMDEVTPNDLEPTNMINMIGIGADLADNNLFVMHNDAAGGATKIDLGADWPSKTAGAVYRFLLSCSANGESFDYTVQRLDPPNIMVASGTISSNMPGKAVFLGPVLYNNNGAGGGSGVTSAFLGFSAIVGGL